MKTAVIDSLGVFFFVVAVFFLSPLRLSGFQVEMKTLSVLV